MQLIYEIFPVFLFFIAFKLYGIYTATVVGIVATFLQVVVTRLLSKSWDKKQLITFGVFVIFGGMTLYFHNPLFVKWKPTVIFWIFSLIIIGSQLFTQKPVAQRLMEGVIEASHPIPLSIWKNLNLIWAGFFLILGSFNLYIAYYYSNDAWVNFKFYGVSGALFLFSIFQALYLIRFANKKKSSQ